MRAVFYTLILSIPLAAQPKIGIIDFYGARKVPTDQLRKALQIKEGDALPKSKGDAEGALELVPGIVRATLEAACCEDGKAILYVGVEEKGAPHYNYRSPPEGMAKLPDEVHAAYADFLAAVQEAARAGETGEDLSQGHSLMHNLASREAQQKFLPLAKTHQNLLRDVLRNSSDEEHRAIAAYVIGYAPKKKDVVEDLQFALQDPDDTVRNNALRSLAAVTVLALKKPDEELKISPTWLIEMLNSIIWADRFTATVTLVTLTEPRDAAVLSLLRDRVLDPLVEMARWKHLPHALPAFILVGRIAGIPETQIQEAWAKLDRESVIKKALPTPKRK